jgi:hypothetical protein
MAKTKDADDLIEESYKQWCREQEEARYWEDSYDEAVDEVLGDIKREVIELLKQNVDEAQIQKWMAQAVNSKICDSPKAVCRYVDQKRRDTTYDILSDTTWSSD